MPIEKNSLLLALVSLINTALHLMVLILILSILVSQMTNHVEMVSHLQATIEIHTLHWSKNLEINSDLTNFSLSQFLLLVKRLMPLILNHSIQSLTPITLCLTILHQDHGVTLTLAIKPLLMEILTNPWQDVNTGMLMMLLNTSSKAEVQLAKLTSVLHSMVEDSKSL